MAVEIKFVYLVGLADGLRQAQGEIVPALFLDPRTQPGELLWPERFGPQEIADLKISLGSYAAAGQLQQRPSPAEGLGALGLFFLTILDSSPFPTFGGPQYPPSYSRCYTSRPVV